MCLLKNQAMSWRLRFAGETSLPSWRTGAGMPICESFEELLREASIQFTLGNLLPPPEPSFNRGHCIENYFLCRSAVLRSGLRQQGIANLARLRHDFAARRSQAPFGLGAQVVPSPETPL